MSNCVKALQSDQRTKGMFRYNMFTNKIEVLNAWWKRSSIALSDVDIDNICLYLDDQYSLTTEKGITKAINVLAHQNEYHPVRELLDNLVWDGEKRIKELFPRYLGADRSEYIEEATKLFMLSKYGKQRAWDRDVHEDDGFHPIEEEADQLEFPFQSENS